MDYSERIAAKREVAAKARRMATQLVADDDRARVLRFAAELEAEADALERRPVPPPSTTQMQMQVQQGPPAADKKADESDPKNE